MRPEDEVFEATWDVLIDQVLMSYNTTVSKHAEVLEAVLSTANAQLKALVAELHLSMVCLGALPRG